MKEDEGKRTEEEEGTVDVVQRERKYEDQTRKLGAQNHKYNGILPSSVPFHPCFSFSSLQLAFLIFHRAETDQIIIRPDQRADRTSDMHESLKEPRDQTENVR
jgi:hypothetical protein